jgi:hypothetical protein
VEVVIPKLAEFANRSIIGPFHRVSRKVDLRKSLKF